jgi:hypothetical protein
VTGDRPVSNDRITSAAQRTGMTARVDSAGLSTQQDTREFGAMFGNRIISGGLWSPRYPDVTPFDSYLNGKFEGQSLPEDAVTHPFEWDSKARF